MLRPRSGRRLALRAAIAVGVAVAFALGVGASEARPAGSDQVTITMMVNAPEEPGYQVLIPNFERAYPSIRVEATYPPSTALWYQLETTELAAGNGPDLVATRPARHAGPICVLAKAGDLSPLVGELWLKWSVPLVTSLGKYGPGLYAFEPALTPYGMFTDDALFAKLGLKVPQTFSQLLSVCRAAKRDGTVAVLLAGGGGGTGLMVMIDDLAAATVYGPDPHWPTELRVGTVSFDGSPGWRGAAAICRNNDAGCFEPDGGRVDDAAGSRTSRRRRADGADDSSIRARDRHVRSAVSPPFPFPAKLSRPDRDLHPADTSRRQRS
jgi:raffinose/stachyose/melibiose transport system substrate-binding protein